MSFDVELPNGTWMRGIPDGTPKEVIQQKAISGGLAQQADFAPASKPPPSPVSPAEELVPYHAPDKDIPQMLPKSVAKAKQAEDKRVGDLLAIPGVDDSASMYDQVVTKSGRIGVSAMAGAELGRKMAGPDPRMQLAGATLGGGVGAAFGSAAHDTAHRVPAHETALNALREGTLDMSFGGGIPILANYAKVLGPAFMKVAGITPEKAEFLIELAKKYDASYGIVDASQDAAVKGVRTVLGVFPWVGTPFRTASKKNANAVELGIESRLNKIAPNATLSQLGVDMTKAAENAHSEWKGVANGLFDSADDYGRSVGATADARSIVQAASATAKRSDLPATKTGIIADTGGKPISNFLSQVSEIANERLTIDELRALEDSIDDLWTPEIIPGDARRLMLLKEGLEKAWATLDDAAANEMYGFAKGFYSDGMIKFSSTTAQKFGRVDKRMFRPGAFRAGSLNEDEVARVAFNLKSPKAVSDLQALVGKENVSKAFKNKITTIIEASTKTDADGLVTEFSWTKMQQGLGMTGDAVEEAALDQVLKGSGVKAKEFYDLVSLGMQLEGAPSANKFVARRAVMGGFGAITGAFVLGGANAGIGAAVVPAIMGRYGATMLTDPEALKALVNTLKPGLKPAVKRVALARLMKMTLDMEEAETNYNQREQGRALPQ